MVSTPLLEASSRCSLGVGLGRYGMARELMQQGSSGASEPRFLKIPFSEAQSWILGAVLAGSSALEDALG